MPRVTVTKADVSTKGKPRVYFDNKHNWQDSVYIGNECGPAPAVGMVIDADTSSKRFPDAKSDIWFLNRWTQVALAANGAAQQQATPQPIIAPQMAAPTQKPHAGWDIPSGDLSRFASNIVGQAITAGLIKKPGDVAGWTAAAYRAAECLRSGKVQDFDDELPDLSGMTDKQAEQISQDEQGGFDEDEGASF
jgi:hypothetical protein